MTAISQAFLLRYFSPVPLIEMGLRRALGTHTAEIASYYAIMSGFKSSSHVKMHVDFQFDIGGTMSHAYVTSHEIFNGDLSNICIPHKFLDQIKMNK